MEISVTYGYTKNMGDYESERLQVTVSREVDPGEEKEEAFQKEFIDCRQFVWKALSLVREINPQVEEQISEALQRRGRKGRR